MQIHHLQFCRSEVQNGSQRAQIKVLAGLVPSRGPGEELFPGLFQLLEAACMSWIRTPSSIFKSNHATSTSVVTSSLSVCGPDAALLQRSLQRPHAAHLDTLG